MQTQQPPQQTKAAGRGLVIAGMVAMALAVVGVVVTVAIFGGRLDLDGFNRDVAITGDQERDVPGFLGFRVIESLSSDQDVMTVGVALSSSATTVDCEIVTVQGDPVELRRGSGGDAFLSADIDSDWSVAVVAEDLEPGEYSASCEAQGEPSMGQGDQFTVGRVVTVSEVFDFAGPAFGIFAGVVIGGFVGLVGLILLVVGLVIGNRAKKGRPPSAPPSGPGQGTAEGRGPGDGRGAEEPRGDTGYPPGPPPWNGG